MARKPTPSRLKGGARMERQSIPQMFFAGASSRGQRPAQLVKRGGTWQATSWQAMSDNVRDIATGLLTLGLQVGDHVALLASSRAEWVQCDLGIMAAAGITVPVYPSSTPDQVAYILHNAEATLACVDTPAQLEKLLQVRAELPALRHIVLMEGQPPHPDPLMLSLQELMTRGAAAPQLAALLDERLRGLTPDHEATYVYTSGTTGPPKGVVQTHGNHLFMVQSCGATIAAQEGDVHLLFLPLAHSFARLEAFLGLCIGLTTAFAESLDTLAENMREVRPMLVFSVPRVYEKIYARVQAAGNSGSPLKRTIFQWCVGVGRQVSTLQQRRQPIPAGLRLRQRLAHQLVFKKLHQSVGGRLRFFVSGGAPLAQDIAEFFHAAGILILEGYGLTETCPALTANRYDQYKFGTVGTALPGVELRLAPDGEILARGPNIAQGYYKRPAETAEVFLEDGWFATGDIGEIDHDGFLRLTDRKKDLIVTAGGKNIAPQNLENALKKSPLVSQALVIGDRRPYVAALVTLEADVPRDGAEERIQALVDDVNRDLSRWEQIKRFTIL